MLTIFEKTLLQIARNTIKEKLTRKQLVNKNELLNLYPALGEQGAVFVTLNKSHQLRGCIGSIVSYRTLFDDIRGNAKAAAFGDPRFNKLEIDEVDEISIEISILSKPEPVAYNSIDELKKIIQPFRDGIVLSKGYHKAVFLPQVWDKVPDFDNFFKHLCNKARLADNCLMDYPAIELFRVTIIEEE